LNVGRDYYPHMVWYWRWPFLKWTACDQNLNWWTLFEIQE
jgi:hypothetical protein